MPLLGLMLGGLLVLSPKITPSQTASPAADSQLERALKTAIDFEDTGDLKRAESTLSALRKTHPGVFSVDESLGLLLAREGKFTQAIPPLRAAVRDQPSSDVAHANLGAALYQAKQNRLALKEFEESVRINPQNVSSLMSLGRLWMENGVAQNAASALLAAHRLKPEDQDLTLDCASAFLAANRIATARQLLTDIEGVGSSSRAQSLLGQADEMEGKFQSAAEHFDLAAELDPSEENAWRMGIEFLQHWTFETAEKVFEAGAAKYPNSLRIRLGLGAAYFGGANYAKAISVFADLLEKDPDNAIYANLLGMSCIAPMREEHARCSELLKYARSHPNDAQSATYAASSLIKESEDAENLELARQLLQRAIAVEPDLAEAQFEMGVLLQESGKWPESAPYLERAIRLRPDFGPSHYRLARAYRKMGREKDSLAQIELQKKCAQQEDADIKQRRSAITQFIVNDQ